VDVSSVSVSASGVAAVTEPAPESPAAAGTAPAYPCRLYSRDRVEQAPRQESAFAIGIAIGIGIERTGWSGIHR